MPVNAKTISKILLVFKKDPEALRILPEVCDNAQKFIGAKKQLERVGLTAEAIASSLHDSQREQAIQAAMEAADGQKSAIENAKNALSDLDRAIEAAYIGGQEKKSLLVQILRETQTPRPSESDISL